MSERIRSTLEGNPHLIHQADLGSTHTQTHTHTHTLSEWLHFFVQQVCQPSQGFRVNFSQLYIWAVQRQSVS